MFVLLFSKGSVFIACNSNGQEASVTQFVVMVSGNIAQSVRCLFCNHDLGFILYHGFKELCVETLLKSQN